jgi:hypothetical protein
MVSFQPPINQTSNKGAPSIVEMFHKWRGTPNFTPWTTIWVLGVVQLGICYRMPFQLHFRLQHFCLHLCKIRDGILWHTYCTKIMVWYLLCCDKLIYVWQWTPYGLHYLCQIVILVQCVSQLTLHIFHIVMNETIKFITHMCHEPWSAIIGKTIFCCSAEECHESPSPLL